MSGTTSKDDLLQLVVPAPKDFSALSELMALAFAEKGTNPDGGKAYQKMQFEYPQKVQHCRIVRAAADDIIMGAIQLQMQGDPGMLDMPREMRHKLQPGEVYLEFIACHPDHTGKGIGSKMLQWADDFAAASGASILSLEVMGKNKGAIRLYERKGYVVKKDPHLEDECESCINSCFVFCCMGCKYWKLVYMEKDLKKNGPRKEEMDRPQEDAT